MERKLIYQIIDGERNYQDNKWTNVNVESGIPDDEKSVAEWINYMEYHISRAKEAVYHLNTEAALAEMRKVIALGIRAMEINGCPERVGYSTDSNSNELDELTEHEDAEEYLNALAKKFRENHDIEEYLELVMLGLQTKVCCDDSCDCGDTHHMNYNQKPCGDCSCGCGEK